MSEFLRGLIQESVGRAVGTESGYKAAPYLTAPSAAPDKPLPSDPSVKPNFPLPLSRDTRQTTPDTMMMRDIQDDYGNDSGTQGAGYSVSSSADGGLSIDVVSMPSASAVQQAQQMSGIVGMALDQVTGMVPSQDPVTGLVTTSPPNMSMLGVPGLGPVVGIVSGLVSSAQQAAATNAAQGKPNNGLVSINGRTVAVVNGKLTGVLPENIPYHVVQKKVQQFLKTKKPTELAGALSVNQGSLSTTDIEGKFTPGETHVSASSGPSGPVSNNTSTGMASAGLSGGGGSNNPADQGGGSSGSSGPSGSVGPGGVGTGGGGMGQSFGPFGGFALGGVAGRAGQSAGKDIGAAGFVGGPPERFNESETVADTEETQVQDGTFIINAPAVEFAGSDDIRKMILEAYATAKEKGLDIGGGNRKLYEDSVDVALSKGEVIVPPALVKIIGLDRLRKINNRGKREVDERQQNMRKGGFIEGYADGDVVEGPYGGVPALTEAYDAYKNRFSSPKAARKVTAKLIQNLPAEDVLALVMMGEASVLGDEGMRGVAHVLVNRTNSEYEDFAKQSDVHTAALTKTGSGIYQFNALEPTTFRRTLKDITQTDYGRAKYERVRNDAEEILAGVQDDFTKGSLFFWNPKTSTDKSFKNKVKSGEWVAQGQTRTKSGLHEYLAPRM